MPPFTQNNVPEIINEYKVILLGATRCGKTVFLSSLFKKLRFQGDWSFFLECDDPAQRNELINNYNGIIQASAWPEGTRAFFEWNFTCKVQTAMDKVYSACRFKYIDYAGGRLTGNYDETLEKHIKTADCLLAIIDGQKVLQLMLNKRQGLQVFTDLDHILGHIDGHNQPVHFAITKWDLLQDQFTLSEIVRKLMEYEQFRLVVNKKIQFGCPVRVIPVSSIGFGFAKLENDEMKIVGSNMPKPLHLEVPLAYVVPDKMAAYLNNLTKQQVRIEDQKQMTNYSQILSPWDKLRRIVGVGVQYVLPEPLRSVVTVFQDVSDILRAPAEEKMRRYEENQRQLNDALREVHDQASALNYMIRSCVMIQAKFENNFPASDLSSNGNIGGFN